MSISKRKLEDAVVKAAKPHGLKVELISKTKHYIFRLTGKGVSRSLTLSGTPRSGENLLNWIRQDVNRLAREIQNETDQ